MYSYQKKKKKNKLYYIETSRSMVQGNARILRLLTGIMIRLLLQLHYNIISPCRNKLYYIETSRSMVQGNDRILRLLTGIMIRLLLQLHYNTISPCLPLKRLDLGVLNHQ